MGASAVTATLIAMTFLPCSSAAERLPSVRETVVEVCPDTVRMLYSAPLDVSAASQAAIVEDKPQQVVEKKKPAKKKRRARKRRR